jgi:23S rRNA (cytidine1920-2'-O)/16S rRNA (cytidine1409-2'-O)-methyltransferase
VNARYLQAQDFPTPFDLVVVDVSFISATKVLPAIVPLLRDGGSIVTLIKPQFEVGRGEVGGGGIVRDPAKRAEAIATVNHAALELGLSIEGVIESPIQGAEGNVEFLALYARS